jgi:hypothetical protein
MTDYYANWRKRLAGETVKTFLQPQLEGDCGYYRRPITEAVLGPNGKTNGQKRIIGWEPVAYFPKDGTLHGAIGARRMTANEVTDEGLWSWVVRYPIKEETYRGAVRGEPWPDLQLKMAGPNREAIPADGVIGDDGAISLIPAKREVTIGDNKPPAVEPHIEYGEAIDNAVRAARDLQVTDEVSAGILLGAKNRIAELRLAADKAGHAIYDPLHAVYKAEQKKWPPMIAVAETMEEILHKRWLIWRAAEKKKADELAAAAAAEAARIEEANARAADRAIAQGIPEPAPVVPEPPLATAAVHVPVAATYRAPGQRTKPKEVETWHLDGIDDYDAVYNHFKNIEDVKAALMKVALAAIKNGQEVPGTRRHFGLV